MTDHRRVEVTLLTGLRVRLTSVTPCDLPGCLRNAWWATVPGGVAVCTGCEDKDPLIVLASRILKRKEAK